MEINNIRNELNVVISDSSDKAAGASKSVSSEQVPHNFKEAPTQVANESIIRPNIEALKQLLISYGLPPSKDNIELFQKLQENNMPSNKQTLMKLNQALKLFNLAGDTNLENSSSLEKAVFTLKNQLPITNNTVNKLNNFLLDGKSIVLNLEILEKELNNLEETQVVKDLKRLLSEGTTELLKDYDSQVNINSKNNSKAQNTIIHQEELSLKDLELVSKENGVSSNITNAQREEIGQIAKELSNLNNAQLEEALKKAEKIISPNKSLSLTGLKNILDDLFNDDPNIKDIFRKAIKLKSETNNEELGPVKLLKGFSVEPKSNDINNIEEKLNTLKEVVEKAISAAEGSEDKLPEAVYRAMDNLKENLDFVNTLKTCTYIPIPLNLPTGQSEAELYVFKDGRGKKTGGSSSALIALNTVSLDRIEAYIQKHENNLNIQFRLGDFQVSEIIRAESIRLKDLLDGAGLNIASLTITPLDRPFNVLQNEPNAGKVVYDLAGGAFDVRA